MARSVQALKNKREYVKKWSKAKTKSYSIRPNIETEADIIAILDKQPNKRKFIMEAIRKAGKEQLNADE